MRFHLSPGSAQAESGLFSSDVPPIARKMRRTFCGGHAPNRVRSTVFDMKRAAQKTRPALLSRRIGSQPLPTMLAKSRQDFAHSLQVFAQSAIR